MLLFDCGPKAGAELQRTKVLDDVDRVIFHLTHPYHEDHCKRVRDLADKCLCHNIDFHLLFSGILQQDTEIFETLRRCGLTKKEIMDARIWADDARKMCNLKYIGFKLLPHGGSKVQTTAVIMEKFGNRKLTRTIYAADHKAKSFVEGVAADEKVEDFITDCTHKTWEETQAHFPVQTLCEAYPRRGDRDRVTVMHTTNEAQQTAYREGFRLATDYVYGSPLMYFRDGSLRRKRDEQRVDEETRLQIPEYLNAAAR